MLPASSHVSIIEGTTEKGTISAKVTLYLFNTRNFDMRLLWPQTTISKVPLHLKCFSLFIIILTMIDRSFLAVGGSRFLID